MSPPSTYAPSYEITVGGTNLNHGTSVDVISLSLVDTFDDADTCTITVRDRYPEANRMFAGGDKMHWLDSDVFKVGGEIEVKMGYTGQLDLEFKGEVTALSVSFPASSAPTLTVECKSFLHRMMRRQLRKPFRKMTDSAIAKEVASIAGLTPDVDDTDTEHALVSPNGKDCAQFLKDRAKRIGYELAVKEDKLLFKKPGYISDPSPALTLTWGKDLESFSTRLTTHKMPTEITVRSPQTSEGRGKDPIVGTAKAGDERVKMGTETGLEISRQFFGDEKLVLEEHSITNEQEANEVALAELERRALDFIQGQGGCIGNPLLRARTVVHLDQLGERFSGDYYVVSTTHNIGETGYRTQFTLKRNAL
jgi:uncharacterized protein